MYFLGYVDVCLVPLNDYPVVFLKFAEYTKRGPSWMANCIKGKIYIKNIFVATYQTISALLLHMQNIDETVS